VCNYCATRKARKYANYVGVLSLGNQQPLMLDAVTERLDHPFTKRSGDMVSMPWKERSIVEERMRFVLRLKYGESMASLCREFGISHSLRQRHPLCLTQWSFQSK